MNNLHQIKTEIKSLSKHIQAINEIDGLLWKSNEILNSFTILDWKYLNEDLINWSNDELQILAETIINGNDGEDIGHEVPGAHGRKRVGGSETTQGKRRRPHRIGCHDAGHGRIRLVQET